MLYRKKITILSLTFILITLSSCSDQKPASKKLILVNEITPCLHKGAWCKSNNTQSEIAILFPDKITYLKPFTVQVRVLSKIKIQQMQLLFSMQGMQMPGNGFKLKKLKTIANYDIWQTEVVIPICVSGRKDWLVELDNEKNNVVKRSRFMITVW